MKPAGLVPHGRTRLGLLALACALLLLLTLAASAFASPGSVTLSASQTDPAVGESVTYTANVSGGHGPFTYQFNVNGSPGSPSSSNTATTSFPSAGTRTVSVEVTDAHPDSEAYTHFSGSRSVTVVAPLSGSVTSSAEGTGVM